ncbi:Zinc/cadmium resistance protein [Penicillium oxalicum]|uniref:Zinc/cadmium resistance protein n=1 Tax=Penicillium oxalicum TaxID=69781 RepID=UPI0020B74A5C|nr:Zinc/cadmium resistance protein [Penicillium oxalicum]KAI2785964.1 Zinc/cadmium resistance protein [Penicillium oxalicum]
MGLSKTNRIIILLVIDTAFFLLELITGYAVHSLALVADSFHMLNDVLSLCVGLWAVKVANRETNSQVYTFGWQRAETLGALVNGVFLVALCLSIFLEAIQRLVEPQEVQNPKLVCIVGCFGLASNLLGLALFHDHSHGGHGHGHGHDHGAGVDGHDEDDVEQGHNHAHEHEDAALLDTDRGGVDSVRVKTANGAPGRGSYENGPNGLLQSTTEPMSPSRKRWTSESQSRGSRRYSGSLANVEDIYVHPATLRQDIIAASRGTFDEPSSDSDSPDGETPTERSGLLRHRDRTSNYTDENGVPFTVPEPAGEEDVHKGHNHAQPKPKGQKGGHGHGHGHDLNMRGVFLHVMGDALGNIGVIASALFIWLTDYDWRFYVDPGISLIITVIILASAIPLCKAASRILLQAAPQGMSVDHIKEDIERLPGVIGTHHLHVWQLNDTKLVASIHIQVDTEIKDEGSKRYMRLARQVRRCLHAYGIHSSTIQPEFAPGGDSLTGQPSSSRVVHEAQNLSSREASIRDSDSNACLLECDDNCARNGQCCPQKST